MDDCGIMATSAQARGPVADVARRLAGRLKAELERVRLPVHKEAQGEGLDSFGATGA